MEGCGAVELRLRDERGGGGPASGARAAYRDAPRVGEPFGDQAADRRGAVLYVDDAPAPAQAVPVGPAVAGGAAVLDVEDSDAPAGEVGDVRVGDHRDTVGGAAVRQDQEGRQLVVRPAVRRVVGRMDVGVHLLAPRGPVAPPEGGGGESGVLVGGGAEDLGAFPARVHQDHRGPACGTCRDPRDPASVRGGRGPLRVGPLRVDDGLCAVGGEMDEAAFAHTGQERDASVAQGQEPAGADPPESLRALLRPAAEVAYASVGRDLVQVPPAVRVGDREQPPRSVGGPVHLCDRPAASARHPYGRKHPAFGRDVGHHELGAVPGHVRVVPAQPGDLAATGRDPRSGHEPVAGGQHPDGLRVFGGAAVQRQGDQLAARARGAVPPGRRGHGLAYAPHLRADDREVPVAVDGVGRPGRADRLGAAAGPPPVDPLVAPVGEDDAVAGVAGQR